MNWKRFSWVNNLLGWLLFAISSGVYLLTMEPTASLWDCAEFIACDYRLQIGHPPGAPFYMLVYNAVSHLAPSIEQVALYANAASAIVSGLTIMFLFWTLTHMLRRLVVPHFRRPSGSARLEPAPLRAAQCIALFGAATVGALAYTFSDTFWFSAVEAEVYALSSLFTAVVFWMMFQWDERSESLSSDRWLVLIAYLMGLSIGVHLLNLLCLPAMALIYYYRKSSLPTLRGAVMAVLVSFALIVVMMYGIVQGVPKMAGRFDYFFVNTLGTSFNSGLYFYLALVLSTLAWSVAEAHRAVMQRSGVGLRLKVAMLASVVLMGIPFLGDGYAIGVVLSLALAVGLHYWGGRFNVRFVHVMQMSLLAIAIGFSSYGVILVRAVADTPMNENAPANAFSLRYYLAREQYGSAPLLYGQHFAARPTALKDGKEVFGKAPKEKHTDPDRYTKLYDQPEYEYSSADKMLFPRIYSRSHAQAYNGWIGRRSDDMTPPSFADNIYYFFNYQVNYMYWRYFMWNFVGRQNDLPGTGGLMQGNAITGIPFIDTWLVGPTEDMPDSLANNKGRNVYYALPLLLGLLGMYYQVSRTSESNTKVRAGKTSTPIGHQSFWITFLLFFMTGLAIVLYLNQTPGQPRERDYAYAGSFYAFAIWIGIGVIGLWRLLSKTKLSETTAAVVAVVATLIIPLQMAGQNWDDHDRSGRTIARDIGINYLESVEPNAILFCYGDNDTFPLWYIQDVEGIRTDVRTVNLSYLGGDWYIDQMRRKTYEGEPVPMKYMSPAFYYFHEAVYIEEGETMKLDEALAQLPKQSGSKEAVLPTAQMILPVDTTAVASMLKDSALATRVVPEMQINLKRRAIDRGTAVVLDMISANEWKRPIYWTSTSPRDAFDNLADYQVQTGMAYQLLPVDLGETKDGDSIIRPAHSKVRLEQMYDNVMSKFRWGGADNPSVYFDETARAMMQGVRGTVIAPLAMALLDAGDTDRARLVLEKALASIRPEVVPYDDYYSLRFLQALYRAEMTEQADEVALTLADKSMRALDWMLRLSDGKLKRVINDGELYRHYDIALMAYRLSYSAGSKALSIYEEKLLQYSRMFGN